MRFLHSLTFRVLVGSCLLLFALFGLYSYYAIRIHTEQMMAQVLDSANRVSDIIKNATHYSMMQNRSEDVYQIISTIGREPGVEGIRIYNKRGMIMTSTNPAEEHSVVDLKAEACYVCHDSEKPLQSIPAGGRARTYTAPEGRHIVGLINPIRNEPSCSNADCHAHPPEQTVLGVLDVRMSLDKVDRNIAQARNQYIFYAVTMTVILTLISGVFLFMTVHRPVQKLREGTKQISSGHLDYRILLATKDEIGELAAAFNEMTESLQKAELENRTWSETLERRVQEKTEELQQIHEQILQIEKMASLGKLSATVAHELNNPLEGILTYSKLIARRLGKMNDESMKPTLEDLDLIIGEIQRCGNIVKNLLLFSRKQVGEFSLVPIGGIVDKVVRLMQHHFKISNVRFHAELPAGAEPLMCDENQIQQALIALFVNAVEAMPGGGELKITVDRSPSEDIRIRVADNGVGIASEDIPHLFEPFFSTKKGGKGVGLGLSVVYGIIERHEGTVTVESEPGRGTIFVLIFPRANSRRPRIEAPGNAPVTRPQV